MRNIPVIICIVLGNTVSIEKSESGDNILPPVTANMVPPVNAAAPIILPRFQLAQESFSLCFSCSSFNSSSFKLAIADVATIVSMASYIYKVVKNIICSC